jgi:hypothetical protein
VTRAQARSELELLSRRFRAEHSLDPNGISLAGTALLSHPGSRKKDGITAMFTLMFAASS